MAYVVLLLAIASEILGTSLLKATHGFTRWQPSLVCILAYAVSAALLAIAVQYLPVGVAYALWSGLGTAAIVAIGVAFLGERLTVVTGAGIGLIVAGVVTVNLAGAH